MSRAKVAYSVISAESTETSRVLFDRARRSLAGGTASSARVTSTGPFPYPLYIARGKDAHIWDVDGNEYVDYLISYGCAVIGHANPAIGAAVADVMASGTMFGAGTVAEIELAETMGRMIPCADLVRFANSGSEAIQGAVRAARGFTGRDKVLKFEGHYHGWADSLAVSNRPTAAEAGPYARPHARPHSPGVPAGVVADVVICPWNDAVVLREILDAHRGELAAVICEPIVANNACTMPVPGYLDTLREECTRRGIVLIFDEVCTGFRTGPGGAQGLFGVLPDLAVYAKALGGGLPIAAFAGRRDIMEEIGANRVKHGGTYNGSPLCAAGALVTLGELADPAVIARIDAAGNRVMEAIRRAARDRAIPCAVQGVGAMFQVVFSADGTAPRNYRDLAASDDARYALFRHALLERGVHVNAVGSACWFVSAALTDDDVSAACAAVDAAFVLLAGV
ncbi:glutamate-1-semialdehyde 2,1-aminomutase [Embleya scabrispora]|uniref:aspartate aminotransferase family protein n=1 Tax=Embleya scabrispora TaxID=159449 RepID=UPI002AA58CB5